MINYHLLCIPFCHIIEITLFKTLSFLSRGSYFFHICNMRNKKKRRLFVTAKF